MDSRKKGVPVKRVLGTVWSAWAAATLASCFPFFPSLRRSACRPVYLLRASSPFLLSPDYGRPSPRPLCALLSPRPSIHRQEEDNDGNTATDTRLLPQCQKPCDCCREPFLSRRTPLRGGAAGAPAPQGGPGPHCQTRGAQVLGPFQGCLLYTSDAADDYLTV